MQLYNSGLQSHPDGTGNINSLVSSNWMKLEGWVNPAEGVLAKQDNNGGGVAGTVVTVTNGFDVFTADDVGAIILFANDAIAHITAYTNAQKVSVTENQLVAAQSFFIYRTTAGAFDAVLRALIKRPQMISADDQKMIVYDFTLQHCVMKAQPGRGVTAGQVLYGNGAGNDLTSSANFTYAGSILTLNNSNLFVQNIRFQTGTLAPSNGVNLTIDFNVAGYQRLPMGAFATTMVSSNLATGRATTLIVKGNAGGAQNLTFPTNWKWGSTKPAGTPPVLSVAVGEIWFFSLYSDGTTDADVYITGVKMV
jgi:hypothetical protein